jgi:hypothetical protein
MVTQTKQIRINIHKRNNTSIHITKTPTRYKTHTYTMVTSPVISSLKMAFLCQMGDVCLFAYKGEVESALSALNWDHWIIFMLQGLKQSQNYTPLSTYWVNDDFAQSNFVLKLVNWKKNRLKYEGLCVLDDVRYVVLLADHWIIT